VASSSLYKPIRKSIKGREHRRKEQEKIVIERERQKHTSSYILAIEKREGDCKISNKVINLHFYQKKEKKGN
jgi:hypothetical protein